MTILDITIPTRVFMRRIRPFGDLLAEVSWKMRMFVHDGVVLAALYLKEPNVLIGISFWADNSIAKIYFGGTMEIGLCPESDMPGRIFMEVSLDASAAGTFFSYAENINPRPGAASKTRAKAHFSRILAEEFPGTLQVWPLVHMWRSRAARRPPIRVG